MKKITFKFLILMSFFFIGTANAQMTEGFEGGAVPAGWTQEYVSAAIDWTVETQNGNASVLPRTGTYLARFLTEDYGDVTKLVTPQQDLTTLTTPILTFYYTNVNWAGDIDELRVYYKNSAAGPWVQIGVDYTAEQTAWTEVSITLPNPTNDYYIAFEATSNWARGLTLDDVSIAEAPTCLAPITLAATNITATSVDLSWVDPSGVQFDFEYAVQLAGTGVPAGAGIAVAANSEAGVTQDIDSNALTANTLYEVYVRADCGSGFSTWSGPITFRTACETFTVPFSEGFNSTSPTEACWTVLNVNADGDLWDTNYVTNPFEGDQSAVIYTDFNAGANDDWLISPAITLTGNQRLKFHYRVQSATEPNDFELLLSTTGNAPASFTNTLIATASYSNITYVEQVVDLSAYSGDVNIAWHVPNGGLDGWRLYIDNVIVEDIPSCVEPNTILASNVTSSTVDLSWTDGSGGAQFDYEYAIQASGTGIPATAGAQIGDVTVVGEGFDINGNPLAANTTYEVYVRADCGGGDFSPWAGPFNFTTACAVFTAPFNQPFATNALPSCWSQGGATPWEYGSSATTPTGFSGWGATGVPDHTSGGGGTFIGMDGSDNTDGEVSTLLSPFIDVTPLTTPRLRYAVFSNNVDDDAQNLLEVEVYDGASWNLVNTVQSNLGAGWVEFTTDLTTLTITGPIQIRYTVTGVANTGATYTNDILIDDVIVEETPSCIAPTTLAATNITAGSVDLTWVDPTGTQFDFEYAVQLAGTGVPAGAGMPVGATSQAGVSQDINTNALTANTNYEVYVRADCGGGDFSTWVGPINFTTSTLVTCGTPVNTVFCYDDNDTTTFTYTSSDGSPLRITFNAGEIEDCCDDILIYDGTNNLGTLLYQGNNGGDLTGLTFDSTSDSIYIEIDSDGSVSCGDGSFTTSWDFDVVCATCVNPTATYTVVPDCGNGQYSIDVDVTSLGTATSLTITDGVTPLTMISTLGIQTFGPYADGASTTITLTNEQDAGCSISSGAITYVCPPSNDECDNPVALTVNADYLCGVVTAGTNVGATDSSQADDVTGTPNNDVWFSFVATQTAHRISLLNIVAVTGTSTDMGIGLYDATSGCASLVVFGSSDPETYNVTGLTIGNTYLVRVYNWYSSTTNTDNFDVCVGTDPALSSDLFDSNAFLAYPNPVKDVLNLEYNSEISSVRVMNLLGQEVISRNINANSTQVDMSQLSAGAYIVNVTVGNAVKTIKVVKQ